MNMEKQSLILRSWTENVAESLYNYAKVQLSSLLLDGLLIHLWKTKIKKYTGKIRQKSGLCNV